MRQAAARAASSVFTDPASSAAPDSGGASGPQVAAVSESAPPGESGGGSVVVSGTPRQGAGTLAWGAPRRCPDCGADVTDPAAEAVVHVAEEGRWCVATLCWCVDQPWYSRESGWFESGEAAQAAWAAGDYDPP